MSEKAPNQAYEVAPEISEAYQMLEMLTDDVLLDHDRQRLQLAVTSDPELAKYFALESAGTEATRKMYEAQHEQRGDDSKYYSDIVDEIISEKAQASADTKGRYGAIEQQLRYIDKFKTRIVQSDSIEGEKLLSIMMSAPKIQPDSGKEAPFKDFQTNTDETWQYVAPETVKEYLGDRLFFDTNNIRRGTDTKKRIQIQAKQGEAIRVPLDILVHAQGFESWNGREGIGSGKDVAGKYEGEYDSKLHSSDVIKHYASLNTELPPVSEITIYVQPDGTMFADNGSGDSHRISAAILRGQSTIEANSVTFVTVDQNRVTAHRQDTI